MHFTHVANPVRVCALVITKLSAPTSHQPPGAIAHLADGSMAFVDAGMLARYTPVEGDYYVTQQDGYAYVNPKDVFERKYSAIDGNEYPVDATRATSGLTFGLALDALKNGERVARAGWNGKGQFVYMVPPASYPVQTGAAKAHFGEGSLVPYNAYIALKTVDERVSTWVPSVTDCLADDWQIV